MQHWWLAHRNAVRVAGIDYFVEEFRMPRCRTVLAALLLASLLVACEEDDEHTSRADGEGVFVELLRVLPDRPEIRAHVEMGNVARAREFLGVEVSSEFNEETFARYATALMAAGGARATPGIQPRFFLPGEARAYTAIFARTVYESTGVSPMDVDQWITGGEQPREVHAIRGRFNPSQIDARLAACAECPAADIENRRGWRIHAWGGDFEANPGRRFQPPMFDHFGRGGRLAVSERFLMRALSTEQIHAMVDAAEGDQSLADNEDLRLAAEGMQRLHAWTATITERTPGASQADTRHGPFLRPYAVMAHGHGADGGGRYAAIALVHETAADAAENARLLPDRIAPAQQALSDLPARGSVPVTRWPDLISDVRAEADGPLMLATVHFKEFDPRGGFGLFLAALLAHE